MMDNNDQTDALQFELNNLVAKFQQEFDLNSQTIIGCLEVTKLDLITDFGIEFIADEELEDDSDSNDIFPTF
jgi:hypothetical protein